MNRNNNSKFRQA